MGVLNKLRLIKNENSGFALLSVLIVLLVVSLLGITLIGTTTANLKLTSVERDYQATYYIAESGSTYVLNEVTKIINETQAINANDFFTKINEKLAEIPNTYSDFEESFGQIPKAHLQIFKLSSIDSSQLCGNHVDKQSQGYKVISEGEIGKRSRIVERSFCVNWNINQNGNLPFVLLENNAVFSHDKILLGSSITGNIGTNSTIPGSIYVNSGGTLTGSIYKVQEASSNIVEKPQNKNFNRPFIDLPNAMNYKGFLDFPSFPEGLPTFNNLRIEGDAINDKTISSNGYYQNITVTSGRTLTIDVGNENRIIRVADLVINQGNINIIGSGTLTLYIENSLLITGGSKVNATSSYNPEILSIYLKGTTPLDMGGKSKLVGSIFSASADINIKGSAEVNGHILTGGNNVVIDGQGSAANGLVFSPNAHVQLTGSGSVVGSVISNNFSMGGGSKVTYKEIDELTLSPFFKAKVEAPDLSTGPIKETN